MDKLKQYIEQNKANMDVDQPPASVWDNIREKVKQPTAKTNVYYLAKYAAAVLLILLAGAGIWLALRSDRNNPGAGSVVNQMPKQKEVRQEVSIDTIGRNSSNKVALNNRSEKAVGKKFDKKSSINVANDLESIDKTYSHLVNHQLERLRTTPVYAEAPEYFSRFVSQLTQMSKDEETIKEEMKQYGLNDRLLEGLIAIYQEKLNLLQTLQKEIRKMNELVKKDESKEDMQAYYLNL